MEAPSISHLAPFLLSLWWSQNSGLFLNHCQHILSWKCVGFLTQADAHSEVQALQELCPLAALPLPWERGRGVQGRGGGLAQEQTPHAEEQGVSDAGFHDRELTTGFLPPREWRLRPGPEPTPHTNTKRELKAEKKQNKPQMPILVSFKGKVFMWISVSL